MSDPIDDTLEHVGRHAGRSGQTIASEAGRQIQRANDERRRALKEAQLEADSDREQAVREAQRKAEREKEQADRLERRYHAAADSIDDAIDRHAAAIQSDGRDKTAVETTANDTTGGESTEEQYDEFELRDREMLRQAGVDPDEVSTSSNAESSLGIDPPTPDLSLGDDGLER